jgi:hypothetical protein
MKKLLWTALLAAALLTIAPAKAAAHEYDRDDSDYPLRYVAYLVHPLGVAVEYGLLRPIHMLVSSSPAAAKIFGHEAFEDETHDYMEF